MHRAPAEPMRPRRARRLRRWHWATIAAFVLVGLPALWIALAYGGLPRLWSHHEHKLIGRRDQIISYTAQDIPGDPINLRLRGERGAIECAFRRAGWSLADPVDLRSGLGIAASVLFARPYPQAPVSPLYFADAPQEFAFQRDAGKSADKRHHIRFWRVAPRDWMAAATFDRGVGLSLFTLQITHHIGPQVDDERDAAGALLRASGAQLAGAFPSRIPPGWHRNGGGDRYFTDGMIHVYRLDGAGC
ncbi:LssY C-terminal domain-containing protein [uncultured Sphingomonas sp.]|uniref:LssY C-terminal domain-containing protein n=1 Tax=uncultured Sphingomonas sp. TaxID=158754 RepID=UPI002632224B|nr:LssY C-terminal domain-containing protein [uncultured Sphingomonas sp.]